MGKICVPETEVTSIPCIMGETQKRKQKAIAQINMLLL